MRMCDVTLQRGAGRQFGLFGQAVNVRLISPSIIGPQKVRSKWNIQIDPNFVCEMSPINQLVVYCRNYLHLDLFKEIKCVRPTVRLFCKHIMHHSSKCSTSEESNFCCQLKDRIQIQIQQNWWNRQILKMSLKYLFLCELRGSIGLQCLIDGSLTSRCKIQV